jgi:hypothetical protein
MGDRIYYDGGSVSEEGFPGGRGFNPSKFMVAQVIHNMLVLTTRYNSQLKSLHRPVYLLVPRKRIHLRDQKTKPIEVGRSSHHD